MGANTGPRGEISRWRLIPFILTIPILFSPSPALLPRIYGPGPYLTNDFRQLNTPHPPHMGAQMWAEDDAMLKRTESFMKMKAAPALINLWRELDGDDVWQAAFDGVLAGVDAELIEELYAVCEFVVMERPSMSGDFSIYLDDGFPNEYKSALHAKWCI